MSEEGVAFLVGAFLGCVLGGITIGGMIIDDHREIMIQQGCGYYNTTTGDFKVKEKEE